MPATGLRHKGTDSHMSLLRKIFIQCESCSHSAELDLSAARRTLKCDLTHEIIPTLFNAFKCSSCGARKPRILDEHRLPLYHRTPVYHPTPLYDKRPPVVRRTPLYRKKPPVTAPAREIVHCIACGRPIDAFHLADMPGALFCASCEPGSKPGSHASPYPQPPPRLSTCPRCKYPTVVRQRSNDNAYFIGCSAYPKCHWTNPLPPDRN